MAAVGPGGRLVETGVVTEREVELARWGLADPASAHMLTVLTGVGGRRPGPR